MYRELQSNYLFKFLIIILFIGGNGCALSGRNGIPQGCRRGSLESASFSPTNKTIVFSRNSKYYKGIFLMNYKGEVLKWLKNDECGCAPIDPVFSPDGDQISFVSSCENKYGDIYIMDKDGKHTKRLTKSDNRNRYPKFSLDGKGIYYRRQRNPTEFLATDPTGYPDFDIFYIDTNTSKEVMVTEVHFHSLWDYALLPNEEQIMITTAAELEKCAELWVYDVAPLNPIYYIEPDLSSFSKDPKDRHSRCESGFISLKDFILSKDGRYIVFNWNSPNSRHFDSPLFILDMKTNEVKLITRWDFTGYPYDISADNNKILFGEPKNLDNDFKMVLHGSDLWMVNRDGSGLKNIRLDFSKVAGEAPK